MKYGESIRWLRTAAMTIATACALLCTSQAVAGGSTIHVSNSPGGVLLEFIYEVGEADRAGTHVVISGYCHSSCTVWLSAESVCAEPGTLFGFHRPFISGPNGRPIPEDRLTSAQMWQVMNVLRRYRDTLLSVSPALLQFYDAHVDSVDGVVYATAESLAAHRIVDICP
jgi:hypothetical protein